MKTYIILCLIWFISYFAIVQMEYSDNVYLLMHANALYLELIIIGTVLWHYRKPWLLLVAVYLIWCWVNFHIGYSWGIPDAVYDPDLIETFNRGFP